MVERTIKELDNLVNLFSLFCLGTLSFIIFIVFPFKDNLFLGTLHLALILILFSSYEWVFLSIITHYLSKNKNILVNHLIIHKKKYFVASFFVVFLAYLIVMYIIRGNIVGVLGDGLKLIALIVGGFLLREGYNIIRGLPERIKERGSNISTIDVKK